MKKFLAAATVAAAALIATPSFAALTQGATAPEFSAKGMEGGKEFTFKLSDALKKGPVVMYFFPAAFTPGCTAETKLFADAADQFKAAVGEGKADLKTFHEIADVKCGNGPDAFTHIVLRDVKAKTTTEIEANVVLPMLGFVSNMGAINEWGLRIEKDEILVSSTMDTGRPGIYAAGDVTKYDGKLKLIASGFGEAATAVNQAVHWIYPDKKVAPGHSSNMAVFGQKDD